MQKLQNLFNKSYGMHITPLVTASLRGKDTHTCRGQDQFLETKCAMAWGQCAWVNNQYHNNIENYIALSPNVCTMYNNVDQ